jgi:putative SOS response-associated peptidase YedK
LQLLFLVAIILSICCRYYIDKDDAELAEIIEAAEKSSLAEKFVVELSKPMKTDGEIRPTDVVPVIAPGRSVSKAVFPMRWGFLLPKSNSPLVNARVETAAEKPTFKNTWKAHRCIVPASWYFEWQHFKAPDGKEKTGDKFLIQPRGSSLTWLCGLYRFEGNYPVFTILTREPSSELSEIHDRMPLILPKEKIDEWIRPDTRPEDLLPFALTEMVMEKTN